MKNVLYRALGQADNVDVDVYELQLNPGDRLVLCSDGLTRHVPTPEIGEVAGTYDDPQTISANLIDLANARGGEDNVSVIVIQIESDPNGQGTEVPLELHPVNAAAGETLAMKSVGLFDDLITPPATPDASDPSSAVTPH